MVYAAGRSARTVVWVAKQVTDEYRKVIDWLNEETTVDFWALPNGSRSRTARRAALPATGPPSIESKGDWPSFWAWLSEQADAFKATFAQRVKEMNLPSNGDSTPSPVGQCPRRIRLPLQPQPRAATATHLRTPLQI